MKIYTKEGDTGQTSLINGRRVSKAHRLIEIYGELDELNANIGLLVALLNNKGDSHKERYAEDIVMLEWLQHRLFTMSCDLMGDGVMPLFTDGRLCENDVVRVEEYIDFMSSHLPSLACFVIPSGCQQACQAHVCRTVCRRVERKLVRLNEESEVNSVVLKIINRISDLFFVLSRKLNKENGCVEKRWQKTCK